MASLEERVRTAAANYPPLASLIGTGSPVQLRWYDTTIVQGVGYPAVVAFTVTNPPSYVFAARLPTSFALMQFTIWGGKSAAGVAAAESVSQAMLDFFDQLDLVGCGRAIQQNHQVIANRRAVFVQTDTPIFQRVLEVRVFSNDSL